MKSWFIFILFIESILHVPTPVAWHIYSSKQPPGAISVPTKLTFSANPLVIFIDSMQEIGLREAQKFEDLEVTQYYIKNRVEYVQQLTLKAHVKTNVSGSISFQACTDKQCLLPQTIPFSISME